MDLDTCDRDDGALSDTPDGGALNDTPDSGACFSAGDPEIYGDLEADLLASPDAACRDAVPAAADLEEEASAPTDRPQDPEDLCTGGLSGDPAFQAWSREITADLDQDTLEALWKSADCRSPREVELVDAALHPEYESQMVFRTDEVTGRALRDESGMWVTDVRRSAGTQVPDGFLENESGLHLREDKCYTRAADLMRNIREQTDARRTAFGDDVDITYVLSPKFTVGEAERIQQHCEEELGVRLEWQD